MIIAANWKMNLSRRNAGDLLKSYRDIAATQANISDGGGEGDKKVSGVSSGLIAFVPACYLPLAEDILSPTSVQFGAQDCHAEAKGAFTGDVSASMIADFSACWVLCGHSERRQYHAETDDVIAGKMTQAAQSGLNALLCVGESHEDRLSNQSIDVVTRQLMSTLQIWQSSRADNSTQLLVIAYEPIWAIGTGLVASLEQISEMHAAIKACLAGLGIAAPVLYGGSVKPDNAADIFAVSDVDGALVGGASLNAEGFSQIVEAAS